MPTAIIDYYQTVEKVMGGPEPTQEFFRLFMIPGMNHCAGGVGAVSIDYLTYLEKWVEQRQAPDEIIGAHVSESYNIWPGYRRRAGYLQTHQGKTESLRPPVSCDFRSIPKSHSFTRPMYPYPQFAKYASGNPNQASSFRPVQP
jgi:Tannase and feruloyl esterase